MEPRDGSQRADHRALSAETVVPAADFDALIEHLDEDGELVPTLARAAMRSGRASR